MSKFAFRKKHEFILSEESALAQVIELLEYYDIDIESFPDDPDDSAGPGPKQSLERALDGLVQYIRRGALQVNTDEDSKLKVTQTLKNGETIEYSEIGAKAKLAMDRAPGKGYARIYAFMGSLGNLPPRAIEKLPPQDLAVVEVLGAVFSNA